ncbi:hypothetical protein ACF5W4_02610 [Bacillota bacterium Lsc_1132]
MMQLQQFVTEIIEEIGGIVEPLEYALMNVLIPEPYTSYFQNRSEMLLAFDFEVAQENPEAEFVTFGSYLLEQVLAIVEKQALSAIRFAEIDRLEIGNSLKKISEFLMNEQGRIHIEEERPVLGIWAVFNYQLSYISDDKIEKTDQVWVNLLTGEISTTMKEEQNRIVYKQELLYNYPLPVQIDLSKALCTATEYLKERAEQEKNSASKSAAYKNDVMRITNYYMDLLAENEKRAKRAGLSEEKQKELKAKSAAIELERDKQLQDIYNKYHEQMEISLDNGILYLIPLLEFKVKIDFRGVSKHKLVYYNPITKQFFERPVKVETD